MRNRKNQIAVVTPICAKSFLVDYVVFAIMFLPVFVAADESSIFAARKFGTVVSPREIATADFNNDGIGDVVVGSGSWFAVLLGSDDGILQQPIISLGEFNIRDPFIAADYTLDGIVDLVISDTSKSSIFLLEGLGDGTFQQLQQIPVSNGANTIGQTDIDGDGMPDVVITKSFANEVGVLFSRNGMLEVTEVTTLLAGTGITSPFFAIDDFNNDGFPDIGFLTRVWLGDGTGTFSAGQLLQTGNSGLILSGQFDDDGIADLLVYSSPSRLLAGNGDGTFQNSVTIESLVSRGRAIAEDFNGDGTTDIAAVNVELFETTIHIGIGDGSFQDPLSFAGGLQPNSIAKGDINGDSMPDLLVSNLDTRDVTVLLGSGNGSFVGNPSFGLNTIDRDVVAATGDFNNDGLDEIIAPQPDDDTISIVFGEGDTDFSNPQNIAVGMFPESVATGDFNGDGNLDIAVANRGSSDISILPGNGDGTFTDQIRYELNFQPRAILVGNFNQDDFLDLVTLNTQETASVLLGSVDGTFSDPIDTQGITLGSIKCGDFNEDGLSDLAKIQGDNFVEILLSTGDGTFSFAPAIFFAPRPGFHAIADFNDDGISDLAVIGDRFTSEGVVVIRLGIGDGLFGGPQVHVVETAISTNFVNGLSVGDFDGDGIYDLAVPIEFEGSLSFLLSGSLSVLPGLGDGNFAPAQLYDLVWVPRRGILSGNFNFHPADDLIVSFFPFLLNQTAQLFTSTNQPLIGDVNLDGQVNLLDVAAFVEVLLSGGFQAEADIDQDGDVTLLDVPALIDLLQNG